MKKQAANLFTFTLLISSFACSSPSLKASRSLDKEKKIESVKIGDPETQVERLWSSFQQDSEKYPAVEFKTLTHLDPEGQPDVFFTIDKQTNKVIGKSLWVGSDSALYNLEKTLHEKFKGISWEHFVPCNTRSSDDKILVNREAGIYIATLKGHVVLVSWTTPDLLKLRIDLLMKTCPSLQPNEH